MQVKRLIMTYLKIRNFSMPTFTNLVKKTILIQHYGQTKQSSNFIVLINYGK